MSRPATATIRVSHFDIDTQSFIPETDQEDDTVSLSSSTSESRGSIFRETFWTLREKTVKRLERKAAIATGVGVGTMTGVGVGFGALAIKAAMAGAAAGSVFPGVGTAVGCVAGLAVVGIGFIAYGARQWMKLRQVEQSVPGTHGRTPGEPPKLAKMSTWNPFYKKSSHEDSTTGDEPVRKGEHLSQIEITAIPKHRNSLVSTTSDLTSGDSEESSEFVDSTDFIDDSSDKTR